MNAGRRREVIVLMATDPAFAERVRREPEAVAAEYDLDAEDLAVLESLRNDSEQGTAATLSPRLSKSSLFFGGSGHAPHAHEAAQPHDAAPTVDSSQHQSTSEFGLLKCDGRTTLHDDAVPAHDGGSEFSLLKCNGRAGLLLCNGHTGPVSCNPHALILCTAKGEPVEATDSAGLPGPFGASHGGAADGGDGGDGLRPIVIPPGSHDAVADGHGGAADGGDGGDGLRPIVIPPGSHDSVASPGPIEARGAEQQEQ